MKEINPNTLNEISEEYIPQKNIDEYVLRPTVRVFVIDENNYIGLIKPEQSDIYFPPGGGVEGDESLFEAAKREVAEELGVLCDPQRVIGVLDHFHESWMRRFKTHHIFASTNRDELRLDYVGYDSDMEKKWMRVDDYRAVLVDHLENKEPDNVWAKAVLYFIDELGVK